MQIEIEKKAEKDILKIEKNYQNKIIKEILNLENYPEVSNIKKLTDFYPPYRLRVGNYRILFSIENETIKIIRVLHRKDAY